VHDVGLGHIVVSKALSMAKSVRETKTGKSRRVPIVLPLRSDLLQWRFAVGEGTGVKLVFPDYEGNTWTESDWRIWSARRLEPAVPAAGRRERAADSVVTPGSRGKRPRPAAALLRV
jgi:hypothetical protein